MSTTSARLLTWENGTDLVIEMPLALGVEDVWKALTDSASVGAWFAPFRLGEEPAEAEADGPAARPITFELGDVDLGGSVLSCEICDHVLLDLDDFGVLGIGLATRETDTAQGAAGTGQGAADADQETCWCSPRRPPDVDTARRGPRSSAPCGTRTCACSPAARTGRRRGDRTRTRRRLLGSRARHLRRRIMSEPLVLGIESSCDETGVGIVRGRRLLTNTVSSSMDEHVRFGGVVPEVASRAHVQAIGPAIASACETAEVELSDIDAVAVTAGPGLSGALMVGVGAAKGLAAALDRPLYGVNHLAAHVAVDLVAEDVDGLTTPTIALLVSGGHTEILRIGDVVDDIELLGATIDDAAGEAFDKTARLLGLNYPAGRTSRRRPSACSTALASPGTGPR
jgi:hypothetical protein